MATPRIISLEPSCTDLVFSLGREQWLCGVTAYCRKIPEIGDRVVDLELPSMGGLNYPRYEMMEKIRPDLVLTAAHCSQQMMCELVSRHFNVVSLNPVTWDDILRNISMLGWLLDAKETAEELVKRFQTDVRRCQRKARELPARPSLYVETQLKPVAFAPEWVRQMCEFVGGMDPFAEQRGDSDASRIVDIADLQRRDPDAIILSWIAADGDHDWEKVFDRPGWDDLRAVREERIYDVDARNLLYPGTVLLDGLDELSRIVGEISTAVADEELF